MPQSNEPEGTQLESADEILRVLEARKARQQLRPAPPALPGAPAVLAVSIREPRRDRPVQRPPMAMLCICDDGSREGEWVRLRADCTVLGRNSGDVVIPHDVLMSGQHAKIAREKTTTGWRWLLSDLNSTNGSFVRVGSTILRNDAEFLIGLGRYRFEAATTSVQTQIEMANGMTQLPQPNPGAMRTLVPSLIEMSPAGPVQRFPLALPEYWIGSDPRVANIARPDDPSADAKHARLYRDKNGHWHVANNGSINGVWLRIDTIALDKACQFRLGEQQFLFRVLT